MDKPESIFKSNSKKEHSQTLRRMQRANTAKAMKRKLQLMKLMLKNEKRANDIVKSQIDTLSIQLHSENPTVKLL